MLPARNKKSQTQSWAYINPKKSLDFFALRADDRKWSSWTLVLKVIIPSFSMSGLILTMRRVPTAFVIYFSLILSSNDNSGINPLFIQPELSALHGIAVLRPRWQVDFGQHRFNNKFPLNRQSNLKSTSATALLLKNPIMRRLLWDKYVITCNYSGDPSLESVCFVMMLSIIIR